MVHLRSETPIQCRPPVAQSQLVNREIVSSEPTEESLPPAINQEIDTHAAFPTEASANLSPTKEILQHQTLLSPQLHRDLQTPQRLRSSPINSTGAETRFTQAMPMTQVSLPAHLRVTASFGYFPSTTELLLPLASLPPHNHGTMFGSPLLFPLRNSPDPTPLLSHIHPKRPNLHF